MNIAAGWSVVIILLLFVVILILQQIYSMLNNLRKNTERLEGDVTDQTKKPDDAN